MTTSSTKLLQKVVQLLKKIANFNSGETGFDIITNGGSITGNDKHYYKLKAMGGDVTLGSGTTTNRGDAPSGTVLQQGDELKGSFDDVDSSGASTGKLYAYFDVE